MSDFDAEAERKRLREKYEAEEERRKETQQMSELLLKGATMTNRHCGECGSPIFRYNEQEFCPSCQQVMGSGDSAGGNATEDPTDASDGEDDPVGAADAADTTGRAGAAGEATDTTGGDSAADEATVTPDATADSNPTATPGGEPASNGVDPRITPDAAERSQHADAPESTGIEPKATDSRDEPSAAESGSAGPQESSTPTRETARESLLAALTRHARLAARTDEPRRAAEHLSAANEAAAALDALDGS